MKPLTILLITWAALAGAEEGPITTWRGPNYDGVMPATGTVREFIHYDKDAYIDEKFRRVKKPGDRFLMQVTQQPGDQKNIVWRTSLPSWGQSAPVVVGDKVFVTCDAILQTKEQHTLVCIDVAIRTNTYLYCIGKGKWRSPW